MQGIIALSFLAAVLWIYSISNVHHDFCNGIFSFCVFIMHMQIWLQAKVKVLTVKPKQENQLFKQHLIFFFIKVLIFIILTGWMVSINVSSVRHTMRLHNLHDLYTWPILNQGWTIWAHSNLYFLTDNIILDYDRFLYLWVSKYLKHYLIFYRKQVRTRAGHLDMDIIPSIVKLGGIWNRNFALLKKVCLLKGVNENKLYWYMSYLFKNKKVLLTIIYK